MIETVTVMTPTYNRSALLKRLYQSLLEQTLPANRFEWLLVDDGSIDNTEEVVSNFIQENRIKIKYYKIPNGGKHRAINYALELIESDLFFIVDSDDFLTPNALERILFWANTIEDNTKYAGVAGCKGYSENDIIGETFNGKYLDCTSIDRDENRISGDKAEVFFTKVIRNYRFPEFENEIFLSECILWNQIARDGYKFRWFNEIVYIAEYLEGGLTDNVMSNFEKNPEGFFLYQQTRLIDYKVDFIKKLYIYGQYYSIVKKMSLKNVCLKFNISLLELFVGICIYNFVQISRKR